MQLDVHRYARDTCVVLAVLGDLDLAGAPRLRQSVVSETATGIRHLVGGVVRRWETGGHQRLADHLSTEHSLGAFLGAAAPKQVDFDSFEVEQIDQRFERCHVGVMRWRLRHSSQ